MNSDTNALSSSPENSTVNQILTADWFDRGRINTKYLSNETRVQIGKELLNLQQRIIDEAVSKEGNTLSAKNKAVGLFYAFVENRTGLKRATARSFMTIANRFSNRPDIIRFLRWRDIAILVSHDDATVDAAINEKLENPEMTDIEFGKSLAPLRPRASK